MALSAEAQQIIKNWIDYIGYQAALYDMVTKQLQAFLTEGGDLNWFPPEVRDLFTDGHLVEYVNKYHFDDFHLIEAVRYGNDEEMESPDLSGHDFSQTRFAILRGVWQTDMEQMQPYAVVNERDHLLAARDHLPTRAEVEARDSRVTPLVYVVVGPTEAVDDYITGLYRDHVRLGYLYEATSMDLVEAYLDNCLRSDKSPGPAAFFQKLILRDAFAADLYRAEEVKYMVGAVDPSRLENQPWLRQIVEPKIGAVWLPGELPTNDETEKAAMTVIRLWLDARAGSSPI